MSTEVVPYQSSPLAERMEYARTLASASDLIPTGLHEKILREHPEGSGNWIPSGRTQVNPGKVLLVMEYGAMLNLHPIAALSGIHVIEGKPSMSAGLMSAVVRDAGHRLRVTTTGTWEAGDFQATATLTRSDDPDFTYSATWTKARADRAGLMGKDNWRKYGEAMCKARAISEVAREGAEDALLGVHYTPEELEVETDSQGEPITYEATYAPIQEETPTPAPSALPKATKRATVGTQGTRRRKAADPDPAPTEEPKAEAVPLVIADETGTHYVDTVTQEPMSEEDAKAARAKIDADREAEPGEPYDPAVDEAHLEPDVDRADPVAVAEYNAEQAKGKTQAYLTSDDERERQAARLRGQVTVTAEAGTSAEDMGKLVEQQRVADAAAKARIAARRAEAEAAERQAAEEAEAEAEERAERERIAAEQAAQVQIAEGGPHPFDVAREEEPDNYARQISAATTAEQLKAIYDAAEAAKAMTSTLRMEIIKAKAHLAAPVTEEPTE